MVTYRNKVELTTIVSRLAVSWNLYPTWYFLIVHVTKSTESYSELRVWTNLIQFCKTK